MPNKKQEKKNGWKKKCKIEKRVIYFQIKVKNNKNKKKKMAKQGRGEKFKLHFLEKSNKIKM